MTSKPNREEELVKKFKEMFPSEEELMQYLESNHASSKLLNEGPFYSFGRVVWKKDGRLGNWYNDILPNLIKGAWDINDEGKIKEIIDDIKGKMKENGVNKSSGKKRKFSKKEIIEKFKSEYVKENVIGNPSELGLSVVKRKNWWGSTKQSMGNKKYLWYEDILPQLVLGAGWVATIDEAREFAEKVRIESKHKTSEKMSKTRTKIPKILNRKKIIEKFLEDFPNPEEAEQKMEQLTSKNIETEKFEWAMGAKTIWKKDGNKGWYKQILFGLIQEAWKIDENEARKFIEKVKKITYAQTVEKAQKTMSLMSKKEVIEKFLIQFPTYTEARRDPLKLKLETIDGQDWVKRAKTIWKPKGKNRGAWYREVLVNIMIDAWKIDKVDAIALAEEIRKTIQRINITNITESKQLKERKYSVVVQTFRGSAKGVSFAGISQLLEVGGTVENEIRNKCGRVVIVNREKFTAELSGAELVRLKMSTDSWGGETAKAYKEAFACIGPYLTTRLLVLHAIKLVIDGKMTSFENGISFMSGPGEVYQAIVDLKDKFGEWEMKIPKVLDIDAEADMLAESENPNKKVARLPESGVESESVDFVECSSLYQFHQRRYPTLVRDTIIEAHRVLREGGVLLLTSTGKRFGGDFETELTKLGFEIITPANTQLYLTEAIERKIVEKLGYDVLMKARRAVSDAQYLVAKKVEKEITENDPSKFVFEKPKIELPIEATELAKNSRNFGEAVKRDSLATKNIEVLTRIIVGLGEEKHITHGRLIQSILSRYSLDDPIIRPEIKDLAKNADRIVEQIQKAEGGDKYFEFLAVAAKTHRDKIRARLNVQKA